MIFELSASLAGAVCCLLSLSTAFLKMTTFSTRSWRARPLTPFVGEVADLRDEREVYRCTCVHSILLTLYVQDNAYMYNY